MFCFLWQVKPLCAIQVASSVCLIWQIFFFLNMGRPDTTPKGFVSPGTEQGIFHLLAKCITTRLWTIYYCQQI